jgi:hypothetical protein
MIKNTSNLIGFYKLFLLTLTPFILALCLVTAAYPSEQGGGNGKGESKNNVFTLYDQEIGRVSEDGVIYNAYGSVLGSVDKNGIIYNVSKIVIGKVEADGSVLNQSGTRLGSVNEQGEIFNVSDRKIGIVKDVSDINLIGGVARVIFFGK